MISLTNLQVAAALINVTLDESFFFFLDPPLGDPGKKKP